VVALKDDLKDKKRKPSNPHSVLHTSRSFFETIPYLRKPKVAPGQSSCIAAALMPKPALPLEVKKTLNFDAKKVAKITDDFDWVSMNCNFTLDYRKLRRYTIVEDIMFSNPEIHEPLLLLVSVQHPMFGSTWLARYKAQKSGRLPIQFCGDTYFQIEATVVKNSTHQQFLDGMYNQEDMLALLTTQGEARVGLHFPNCSFLFDLEFKYASVIKDCESTQVWGVVFSGLSFLSPLTKLKDEDSREAYFTRYLTETRSSHKRAVHST
jgi:hypothetical protein